jgi:glycosyltransferase involved in cell wall biosynthesis
MVATARGYLERMSEMVGRSPRPSDHVFYLSQYRSKYDKDKHGFSEKLSAVRELASGRVAFIFLGTFGYSSELDLICEVATRFANDDSVCFIMVGDGHQKEMLRRFEAELPNFIYPGWMNNLEAEEVLGYVSVGLCPAVHDLDTMPNKIGEYLAAGLPIISSLEGEAEEMLSQNEVGLSYRHGDADALERHIRRLSTDHVLREKLANNSAELYKRKFFANTVYPAYADHVERVARSQIT